MTNFQDMIGSITEGDCLELMKEIPDNCIDMILCDLPYGTTRNKWDTIIPLDLLWEAYNRIIKPKGAIILTAQTPFDKVLGVSNIKYLKYEWIWRKNIPSGYLNANVCPMRDHENVLVFGKGKLTYNPQMTKGEPYTVKFKNKQGHQRSKNYGYVNKRLGTINKSGDRYPRTVLFFKKEKGLHPTQKPLPLFEYMIKTYTNPGELVLDNCIGSGTTAIAAMATGRKFIGIEKDPDYCKVANDRIREYMANKVDNS